MNPVPPQSHVGDGLQMCVECEDTEALYECKECKDVYCALCYMWLHSKGNRAKHTKTEIPAAKAKVLAAQQAKQQPPSKTPPPSTSRPANTTTSTSSSSSSSPSPSSSSSTAATTTTSVHVTPTNPINATGVSIAKRDLEEYYSLRKKNDLKLDDENMEKLRQDVLADLEVIPLVDRCRYIPLRLNEEERQLLNILNGALEVSEYTDNVDVSDSDYGGRYYGFSMWSQPYSRHERGGPTRSELIIKELTEVFNLLMGLYQSADYRLGGQLLKTDDKEHHDQFLQRIFEVGRRYKIMNPDKMRGTYGKLMYILQDAVKPGRLDFQPIIPVQTVYRTLEAAGCLDMLTDPESSRLVLVATRDLSHVHLSASQKQQESVQKSSAIKALITRFQSDALSENDIHRIISSIADNTTFITLERWPVDRMLKHLTTYFGPNKGQGPSLSIMAGRDGSKLSHDHSTQFTFVLQSLMLWREVMNNMFRLWVMTEEDLLSSTNNYILRDTGQGLNRLQACPHVSQAMHSILSKVQRQAKGWVGLSVVHLGDRDVPNALMFIDKYTQVSRILAPLVGCVARLDELEETDVDLKTYFDKFGGVEQLKLDVLQDYFKHGFDGSGSDGGSCIDGRLTSSWNWCSKIEKKFYYYIFLLSGFKGFDGRF